MVNEIKPNYEGLSFSKDCVLIRYENMSLNKRNANDPDYYKVILDCDGQIIECSAWFGCEIEKLQKNVNDVLYKRYKVTFAVVKGSTITKSGSTIEFYKLKVIGIQDIKELFK